MLDFFFFRIQTQESRQHIKMLELIDLTLFNHFEKFWANLLPNDCSLDYDGSLVLENVFQFLAVPEKNAALIQESEVVCMNWRLPLFEVLTDHDREFGVECSTFERRRTLRGWEASEDWVASNLVKRRHRTRYERVDRPCCAWTCWVRPLRWSSSMNLLHQLNVERWSSRDRRLW